MRWTSPPMLCDIQCSQKVWKQPLNFEPTTNPHHTMDLCTYLLKQSKVDVSKHVTERMWNSIHKYRAPICSNGWDNVAQHPLLNIMFTCPNGDVFISSIDTIGERKDAHYICNTLGRYNETIGIDIIQICTNNASNVRSVVNLLIHRFPSLYFQGCVVHCLDLLLED
jgi:hypothetical protein